MVDPRSSNGQQGHPAKVYRITVKGRLNPGWGERLAGMRIKPDEEDDSGRTVTLLEGPIRDRAELAGVLNTLYELHLELLSVHSIGEAR